MAAKPAKPTISPAERAEQQRLQRALIRQALGAQYGIWTTLRKKTQESGESQK